MRSLGSLDATDCDRCYLPEPAYDAVMFTRIRWFIYGAATTLGATVLVVRRARSMRDRLDAEGVTRISASIAADGIEMVGRRLQRSSLRVTVDEGGVPDNG